MKSLRVFAVLALALGLFTSRAEAFSMIDQTEEQVAANTFADRNHDGKPDGALVLLRYFNSHTERGLRTDLTFQVVEYLSGTDNNLFDRYKVGDIVGLRSTPLNPHAASLTRSGGLYAAFLQQRSGDVPTIMSMKTADVQEVKDASGSTQRVVRNVWRPRLASGTTSLTAQRATGPVSESLDAFATRIRSHR